jgi:uridine kinase
MLSLVIHDDSMSWDGPPVAGPVSADPPAESISLGGLAVDILASPPHLGTVRLVVVDGPSGSGKTSLAKRLAWALHRVPVVHLDHLYEGWRGLPLIGCTLDAWVLTPLRCNLPGRHLVYDWNRKQFAEWREVPIAPALVVEGTGAGQRRFAPWTTLRIWVECDTDLRHERALRREAADDAPQLQRWWQEEQEHFLAERTRERADLVVDGTVEIGTAMDSQIHVIEDRRGPDRGAGA